MFGVMEVSAWLTIAVKADSTHRTVEPPNSGCRYYFFAHEADNFLAQGIAGARPHFQPAQVFHARLQRAELQIVRAGFIQCFDRFSKRSKNASSYPVPASS